MDPINLLWLLFAISAFQPVVKQRMLEAARQRMLARIENDRGSRVILLAHRQETMSLLGFPVFRYIDINDSEDVLRAIHLTDPKVPLDLILHTPGGLVLASLQIARAVRRHEGRVTVFVPHLAMSGGTLIALAADEIVMTRDAVLGPVDPQLGQVAAASVLRAVERKPVERVDDQTLILADQAEKAIRQVKSCVLELLSGRYDDDKAENIAERLSTGEWTHDHPITFETARALGLRVSQEMPERVIALMSYFPQPVRRIPSVEYLPHPRRVSRSIDRG